MLSKYSHFYESSDLFHGSLLGIMGTRFDIILVGKKEESATKIWNKIMSVLEQLHNRLNRFDENSEVFFVNLKAHNQAVRISDCLWEILKDCKNYFEKTGGLFDITLNDFSNIQMHKDDKSVTFKSVNTSIDLGGYAKGYAIERVREILIENNVVDSLVDFGNSSVLALGKHPHGETWKLSVPNPFSTNNIIDEIELVNRNLSTSGNIPNHTRHIKNSRTGEFSDERKMVTVIAENAIDAEVISTVLMIAQPDETDKIVNNFNIEKYKIFNL